MDTGHIDSMHLTVAAIVIGALLFLGILAFSFKGSVQIG